MKILSSLLLIAILFTTGVYSQSEKATFNASIPNGKMSPEDQKNYENLLKKPLNGFFGISFTNAVPQNAFYDNLRRAGQGLSVYGGYRFDPMPFAVGMQGDIMWFGGDERIHTYKDDVYSSTHGYLYSNYYNDTISYQNMIIPISFFGRIEPNIQNVIFPYLQANLGFNIFSAHSSMKYGYDYRGNQTNDEINGAWHYGASGGVQIKLVDFVHLPSIYSRMLVDVGFKYIKGTEAKLYTVEFDQNSNPVYTNLRTKTDLLLFQIGLVFQF